MTAALPHNYFDVSSEDVLSRFRWARRQGNPLWVWPDTPVANWQSALVQIEAALRRVLAREPAALEGNDPEDIAIAAYTSGMGPLLGFWAVNGALHAEPTV